MKTIYQFKITLKHSKPPIWRRVLVPSSYTLKELHYVIQDCFEWTDSHFFSFIIFGECHDDENPGLLSKRLNTLELCEKMKFSYIYDFGDGWDHTIILEKILLDEHKMNNTVCIKGKRAGPFEDCGGIWGYENLINILTDKNHPEYDEMFEWVGEVEFDPEAFDLNEINERLAYTG